MAIKQYFTAEELKKDVGFSDNDLSSAMMGQAPLFAHYAVQSAMAQKQADDAKMIMEITEAKVDKAIRDRNAETGEKTTEAALGKAILRDATYIKAITEYNHARMIADLAKNALEALKQRRDMLVQIGVAQREEMKGELRIGAKASVDQRKVEFLAKSSQEK